MAEHVTAVRVAAGMYRIEQDGESHLVYVANTPQGITAFWNGRVFRAQPARGVSTRRRSGQDAAAQTLTAPMPATVIKVLVTPGAVVSKGDTLVVLEAMKMELPVRAMSDAVVAAVLCRAGDMVQPDAPLVELKDR